MKKIKIIQIIGILLFIVYVSLFLLDLIWGILYDIDTFVFSIVLAIISLTLIYKGTLLKSSSTMWFSIFLILTAIFTIILNLLHLNVSNYYYVFAILPIIASIFNLIIFKYIIYIKVIILNISIAIPVFCMQFLNWEWWINLIIGIISVIFGILICRLINFDKEKV